MEWLELEIRVRNKNELILLLTEGDRDVENESLAELSSDGSDWHVESKK